VDRELVADQTAATAGEDRRATGEACAAALAATRGGILNRQRFRAMLGRIALLLLPTEQIMVAKGNIGIGPTKGAEEEKCCKSGLQSEAMQMGATYQVGQWERLSHQFGVLGTATRGPATPQPISPKLADRSAQSV
jgi:hypothetical protein